MRSLLTPYLHANASDDRLDKLRSIEDAPPHSLRPVSADAANRTRPDATTALTRGVARLFRDMGLAVLTEFTLPTGRRLDLIGLNQKGRLIAAEVKSCQADFEADQKWPEYLEYCDAFYFAVGPDFPRELLPAGEGMIIADAYGAAIVREAGERKPISAARRKSLTLRFARQAANAAQTARAALHSEFT